MEIEKIAQLLKEIVGEDNVKTNESMAKHTTFKVGGNADIFVKVKNYNQLIDILNKKIDLPITIVGNGSNLLVKDKGIRGIVIKYTSNNINILKNDEENIVEVDAGVMNGVLAHHLLENGLTGFEFASGIPGTIGGAIYMNAGAYGKEISEVVRDITFINLKDNKIHTIKNNHCNFSYRNSIFMNMNVIIIKATMVFTKAEKNDIKRTMDKYQKKRLSSQPIEYPNGGSTFKRGEGFITAKLIDEAGLKGYKIGGAEVSTKHAGFIINSNNATAEDILKLVEHVQRQVYKKFNKKIELEMRVLGEWKVFLNGLNQMLKSKDG